MTATATPALDAACLARAYERLPARDRTVLALRFGDGMSESQIAAVLGCRPVAVRGIIRKALRHVRREVVRDADGPTTPPTWRAIAAHVPGLPPR